MKSVTTKKVKIFFDEANKHWNTTILCNFFEDYIDDLILFIRDYYKNMGVVERIEVSDTDITNYVDFTEEI